MTVRSPDVLLFLTGFSPGPEGMLWGNKPAFQVCNPVYFTEVEYFLLHKGNDRKTFVIITLDVLIFMSSGTLLIHPACQL